MADGDFGSGIGSIIGGAMAADTLNDASMTIRGQGSDFNATTAPYNTFGQSLLQPAAGALGNLSQTAQSVPQFGDFMQNFSLSPGAQYTMGQALTAADNSAASRGQLLSGNNIRNRETIANGIVNNDIASQYGLTLAGNQQQFGQLQSVLGGLFQGIGVGTTATGQQAGVLGAQMGAQSQLAQAEAKADQGKGSGIGSVFGGIGKAAAKF